ncbi:MAG: hypothetical protein B5M52_04850 [Helicobacteraceae bacterium 4484_230]|nr:MAG: hypothetical protein B5M52_04850 [Helicobacteraceae bacterium 4484_230]
MNMFAFKKFIDDEGIIFSYSGTVSQPILSGIAETIEEEFKEFNISIDIIQSIFAVFTEQMHNIMSYSKERVSRGSNRFESPGISIVGYDQIKKKYFVSSANIMDNKDEEKLLKKLKKVNTLDKQELRKYYRELRKNGKEKHMRGAGLGFLEMAKKSSEQLEYNITHIDAERSFFEIKVTI